MVSVAPCSICSTPSLPLTPPQVSALGTLFGFSVTASANSLLPTSIFCGDGEAEEMLFLTPDGGCRGCLCLRLRS